MAIKKTTRRGRQNALTTRLTMLIGNGHENKSKDRKEITDFAAVILTIQAVFPLFYGT